MPAADQLSSPVDSIDPVNGTLHLKIPLASLPRGRAGSGFDLDLVYDSHLYDINPRTEPPRPPNLEPVFVQELSNLDTTGGWRYNTTNYRLEGETRQDANI